MKKSVVRWSVRWIIIFVVILLFFLQNQKFFMEPQAFSINLIALESLANYSYIFKDYKLPALPNVLIFVIFFLIGVLWSYSFNFIRHVKASRTVKKLTCDCDSLLAEVSKLKAELGEVKGSDSADDQNIIDISEKAGEKRTKIYP